MATRKTHIVRILIGASASAAGTYVDIEVLDAISFRLQNGYEMILSVDASKAAPFITDNTGDGNGKGSSGATRRSHMQRVTASGDSTQFLDVEVIDGVAFRDQNGQQWILDMPTSRASKYNTTTGQGNPFATRRVHNEKIYSDPKDNTSPFMLVERCDTMAFRDINGKQLIVSMPSSDDGSGDGRASSVTTPANYSPGGNAPPTNGDPSVYAFIPSSSGGVCTGTNGDTTNVVACGALWWPRAVNNKVKAGAWYWWTPTQTALAFSQLVYAPPYVWLGNAALSSYAYQATFSWEYMPGLLFQPLYGAPIFTPFKPFGFPSLEAAILHGVQDSDWGAIDYSDTRIDTSQENGLNLNPCIPGVSGSPDIWQLTGIPAPALIKPVFPDKVWKPGVVSDKLAAQVATAYGVAWNGTSAAFNEEMAGCATTLTNEYAYVDEGGDLPVRILVGCIGVGYSYPSTAFSVPLWDMTVIPPLFGGRYIGGLDPNFWDGWQNNGMAEINSEFGSYASSLGVGQLDPKKWDTSNPQAPKLKPGAIA